MRPCATSTRNPSTPRSSQKRSTSRNSARTSSLVQSKSGWLSSKMWRYHCPGVPSASVTRFHMPPPNTLSQLFGGSSPFSPLPSRKMYRARSGLPGAAFSASWNHTC